MTGWRFGEFYNLKNENINNEHVVLNGKQGKRIYPLLEKAYTKILPIDLKSLIQRLKENGNKYFYTINNSHPGDGYLPHKFKKYAKAADLPSNYVPYTLRHTFATQLLLAGVNILAVSKLMGHSSVTIGHMCSDWYWEDLQFFIPSVLLIIREVSVDIKNRIQNYRYSFWILFVSLIEERINIIVLIIPVWFQ